MQSSWTPPTNAPANLRRSSVIAAALGAVTIAISAVEGHPLLGLFATLGLAFGALNNWMLQKSVQNYGRAVVDETGGYTKRQFRGGVLFRLTGITVVAIALALLVHPDGLGVVAGLAAFQILLLVGAALPVFRSLRPTH